MTVTVYASLDEFLAQPDITSDAPKDDAYIEDLLERASRDGVDAATGRWFYAYTDTRRHDLPRGRCLTLSAPLLAITTLTNGDGTVIAATEYDLLPFNGPHYTSIELHADSAIMWQLNGSRTRGVISVAGSWGYVDRDATDPESLVVISATKSACLAIALSAYKKRYGVGAEGVATVTGAGVVITPQGIPADAKQRLMPYTRLL